MSYAIVIVVGVICFTVGMMLGYMGVMIDTQQALRDARARHHQDILYFTTEFHTLRQQTDKQQAEVQRITRRMAEECH